MACKVASGKGGSASFGHASNVQASSYPVSPSAHPLFSSPIQVQRSISGLTFQIVQRLIDSFFFLFLNPSFFRPSSFFFFFSFLFSFFSSILRYTRGIVKRRNGECEFFVYVLLYFSCCPTMLIVVSFACMCNVTEWTTRFDYLDRLFSRRDYSLRRRNERSLRVVHSVISFNTTLCRRKIIFLVT